MELQACGICGAGIDPGLFEPRYFFQKRLVIGRFFLLDSY